MAKIDPRKYIEGLKVYQNNGSPEQVFPCPRCGKPIDKYMALSRTVDVYICDACGTEEALIEYFGEKDKPLEDWLLCAGNN